MARLTLSRSLTLGAVALGTFLFAAPRSAHACSCFLESTLPWPADGGTLPVNSMLVFESTCGSYTFATDIMFQAWVDGTLVPLVPVTDGPLAGQAFVLDPLPAVGAVIELANCGTAEACASGDYRSGEEISFTVVEADTSVPLPPTLASLDYTLEEAPLECGENPTPARDWTVSITGESAADKPLVYAITLGPAGGTLTESQVFAVGPESLDVVLRRLQEDAGSDVCAEVRTIDLSGNEAPMVSSCQTLGEDETLEKGCACSTDGERGAPAWAMVLLVALGLWRRRAVVRE